MGLKIIVNGKIYAEHYNFLKFEMHDGKLYLWYSELEDDIVTIYLSMYPNGTKLEFLLL